MNPQNAWEAAAGEPYKVKELGSFGTVFNTLTFGLVGKVHAIDQQLQLEEARRTQRNVHAQLIERVIHHNASQHDNNRRFDLTTPEGFLKAAEMYFEEGLAKRNGLDADANPQSLLLFYRETLPQALSLIAQETEAGNRNRYRREMLYRMDPRNAGPVQYFDGLSAHDQEFGADRKTDELKAAVEHYLQKKHPETASASYPWGLYSQRCMEEHSKRLDERGRGAAHDEEFEAALQFVKARAAANMLPTASERGKALIALDKKDRAWWASHGPSPETPSAG